MSRKNKVAFIENEDPSFIKQFKERCGYKEGPNVNTKRTNDQYDDSDYDEDQEKEEEKPTVVVLKKGDISQEEADKIMKEAEEPAHKIGEKITFKRPVKRTNDSEENGEEGKKEGSKIAKKDNKSDKKKSKEKKKANLLSFGDEEEEEDG